MARSLSDDPVKLERERLGLSRRLHAIDMKLMQLKRTDEGEPDVATGEQLHELAVAAKAAIHRRKPGERVTVPEGLEDVGGAEWGAF